MANTTLTSKTNADKAKISPNVCRVLAIDDEEVMGYLLKRVAKYLGYEVDWVMDCETALKKIKCQEYQIILSDYKLPDMSGEVFYEKLASFNPLLINRVIFITGDTVTRSTLGFLNRVNAPYLSKPFDIEELKLMIESILHG